MEITIRKVSVKDAIDISRLSGQLGYTISPKQTATQLLSINSSRNDIAYTATIDRKIVGWIHAFYTKRLECTSYCEIGGLVVDEQRRGMGIGKMLIEHIKLWCRDKGCNTLKVRSNVKRTEAHKFYLHSGFDEKKEQKVFEIQLTDQNKSR